MNKRKKEITHTLREMNTFKHNTQKHEQKHNKTLRKKIPPTVHSQKMVNNVQKKEVNGCKKKQKNKPPQKNHKKR